MAYMIPATPRDFDPRSREGEMFKALERGLSDEYTVVHSFKVLYVENKQIHESESDFVVIHPDKGILFIEAKASVDGYRLQRGEWYYRNGKKMQYGSPMKQALRAMRNFKEKVEDASRSNLLQDVRLECCVWLLSINAAQLKALNLPTEIDTHLILTEESLLNIEADIERLFSYKRTQQAKAHMTKKTIDTLLTQFICPEFDLVPSTGISITDKRLAFNRLQEEQSRLLDYLVDQPVGVINGAAGTGKTMLAVEMARRYAEQGEKTLFLCYNDMLCEHLRETKPYDFVDYYDIDAFAVKHTPSHKNNYSELRDTLRETNDSFPYMHVIVDEGQDFGKKTVNDGQEPDDKTVKAELFEVFEKLVTGDEKKGTFFVFYDSNQLIQADAMPPYIENADCRLTLYRNSRNTHCIAQTSAKPLPDTRRIKLSDKCLKGEPPVFMFAETMEDTRKCVDQILERLISAGYDNIQILTMTTMKKTILGPDVEQLGGYRYGHITIPVTTCRKFKGLEADAIILLDVNRFMFGAKDDPKADEARRIFYAGASRARLTLRIVGNLSKDDCKEIAREWQLPKTSNNPQKVIANYFQCQFKKLGQ